MNRMGTLVRHLRNRSWHGRPAHEKRAGCPCRTGKQRVLQVPLWHCLAYAVVMAIAVASPARAHVATGEWTKTTWSTFTAATNNILRPSYLAPGSPYEDFRFCDGCSANPTFSGKRAVAWEFPRKATITGVNIYTQWNDDGRDDIRLSSVEVKHAADGEWETIPGSGVTHNHTSTMQKKLHAHFAAADGAPVAENVVAVRMVFPEQENGYVGYVELEILGSLEAAAEPEPESDYVWTAGGYNASTWQPLGESNMMAYCSSILLSDVPTTAYDAMTDGSIAQYDTFVKNGNTIAWLYAQAFELYAFRVFARWKDAGRDSVSIWRLETRDENGVWTQRTGPEEYCMVGTGMNIDTNATTTGANFAVLRRKDGRPIATDTTGIRVLIYNGDEACWAEVEAEGCIVAAGAIFDERSVTVQNDCWKVDWTASVASFGASDSATVNLWTSLDNENFTLADTVEVTEVNVPYAFTRTFDDVELTIYYKFETVNASGGQEWRSTNATASVVNHNNATYYWKPDVTAGVWESSSNWSNSLNDARLTYPSNEHATASFALLDPLGPVTVTLGAAKNTRIAFAPAGAQVTFTGEPAVKLTAVALPGGMTGIVVADGLGFETTAATFADGARFKARNGAVCKMTSFNLCGAHSGMEFYSGATFTADRNYSYICNDSEIILDGGLMTNPGYFTWSASQYQSPQTPLRGSIVFGPNVGSGPDGGGMATTLSHRMMTAGTCELRYELPGVSWRGYEVAPLRPKRVNDDHPFGGAFHVNVTQAGGRPHRKMELRLIEMKDMDTINTNGMRFAAFGEELLADQPNKRGDYFYWTYDGCDSTSPAQSGALPTGLRFHHSGVTGTVIMVR